VSRSASTLRRDLPIGVFDSGVGGLTVLRELRRQLPREQFIYLGDTARLPYGTKSRDSVLRYSVQAGSFLVTRGVKYLVIACNTAASVAVDELRRLFPEIPVLGVIVPGANAACAASRGGTIGVLATEATVQGGAYQREIAALRPEARVVATACSLFVALAEEGWTDGPIVASVAHRYLDPMFSEHRDLDTLLLGCTHFPVLVEALRATVGSHITIVDSANTSAIALAQDLAERDLQREADAAMRPVLLATDGVERFARVGARFLAEAVEASDVELVDLQAR
jgi:glutamate racemase